MRIAVSGTHCSGKSTLIEDFVAVHRDYVHEPEPWEWLEEMYGEELAGEPDAAVFYRQLEISVERLGTYGRGARVIAERSPLDFLAYILALGDLGRESGIDALMASAVPLAARGMEHVDLLVVLPLNDADGIVAPEAEDLELREAMNARLLELIADQPNVLELSGPRHRRLTDLERRVQYHAASTV